MSILLSEHLTALAKQTGVDTESEDFKNFISNKSLSEITLPDTVHGAMSKNLITLEAAKNNPELAGYFKVKALSGIDSELNRQFKSLGVSDDVLAEFTAEKDTYQRVKKFLELTPKQIEAKLKEQFGDNIKGKEEFVKQINDLSKKYNDLQEEVVLKEQGWAKQLLEKDKEKEQFIINSDINKHLSKFNFNKAIPSEKVASLIRMDLATEPYVLRLVDGQIKVYQKEHPELEAFDGSKKLTVEDVLNKLANPYIEKVQESTRKVTQVTVGGANPLLNGRKPIVAA